VVNVDNTLNINVLEAVTQDQVDKNVGELQLYSIFIVLYIGPED
jgi:hypothetical protein